MANTVGLSRYGFKLEFLGNGVTTSKSYSGVNFQTDDASIKADTLEAFLKGTQGNNGLYAVVSAMGSPYSINGQAFTQENEVTFT